MRKDCGGRWKTGMLTMPVLEVGLGQSGAAGMENMTGESGDGDACGGGDKAEGAVQELCRPKTCFDMSVRRVNPKRWWEVA